jgi:hypothetical protein
MIPSAWRDKDAKAALTVLLQSLAIFEVGQNLSALDILPAAVTMCVTAMHVHGPSLQHCRNASTEIVHQFQSAGLRAR